MSDLYDLKAIRKELKKVIPKRFEYFDVGDILSNDISFYVSIRKDAGKTTNALLLALALYKLYKIKTIYVRNDNKQTAEATASKLFDKIEGFGYLSALFEIWNSIQYKRNEKAFYLCRREDGQVVDIDANPFLLIKSNEYYSTYKGDGGDRQWLMIWDEFLDSTQMHSTLVQKFFENVSTFTRDDPHAHVIALSNGVNKYDAIFEDFCISDKIEFMDFGEHVDIVTDLGSHYYFEMLPVSEEKKKQIEKKQIRFYGISKDKFSNFTGVSAWRGFNYKHLIQGEDKIVDNELFAHVFHRDRWLAIYVVTFSDDRKPMIHIVKCPQPKKFDHWVYCLNPSNEYERLFDDLPQFLQLALDENRFCFYSNNVGLLFDDFLAESGYTQIKDR